MAKQLSAAERRYRNLQSNGFGKNFERFVEMGCDYYRQEGLADISKFPEPFRVTELMARGRFKGQFIGKANPDFEGTLKGGKSICFECKYTNNKSIRQAVVTEKQGEILDAKYKLGGIVGVCCGIGDRHFFVPWSIWANMEIHFGKKSASAEDLKDYEVPFRQGIRFLENIGDYYDTKCN